MNATQPKAAVHYLERGEVTEEFRVNGDAVLVVRRIGRKHRTFTQLPLAVARQHYRDLLRIGYLRW